MLAALIAMALASGPALAVAADQAQLEKVVVLSRHGLRSPTQDRHELESWALRPWPPWSVPRGDLTARGAELIRWTWEQQRERLSPLLGPACPPPGAVSLRADVDERTRASAAALIEGLAPGCGLSYSLAPTRIDPLFHPVKAGVCAFEPAAASAAVKGAGDGLEGLARRLQPQLASIDHLSGRPISRWPSTVKASRGEIGIDGALGIGSSMTEIFALEWGEWPQRLPAWGELDGAALAALMPLHVEVFAQVNRAPYVAARRGSALAQAMLDALVADGGARLSVWVGHDTNIANVAALFGLSWQLPGRVRNEIPPSSALVVERWRVDGRPELRARFLAPSPEQMHALIPAGEPAVELASWVDCGASCAVANVMRRLTAQLATECIP